MSKIEIRLDNKGSLESATVARYRSVDVDGKLYGPGEQVTLPKGEVADLRRKGFLLDPADDDEPESTTPKVKITKGAGAGDGKADPGASKLPVDSADSGSSEKQSDPE